MVSLGKGPSGLNPGDFVILALAAGPSKVVARLRNSGGGWSHSSPIILPLLHLCTLTVGYLQRSLHILADGIDEHHKGSQKMYR